MNPTHFRSSDPFEILLRLAEKAWPRSGWPAAVWETEPAGHVRPSLIARLEAWLWRRRQRDLERSLADAGDVAELERRLRREADVLLRYY